MKFDTIYYSVLIRRGVRLVKVFKQCSRAREPNTLISFIRLCSILYSTLRVFNGYPLQYY